MIPYRGHILAIIFSPLSLLLSLSCYVLDGTKDDAIDGFLYKKIIINIKSYINE